MLLKGLIFGLGIGLLPSLAVMVCGVDRSRSNRWNRWVHDEIARRQHFHRQRVRRSEEHQDVPDTALSRAQPPGDPTPTDAALSVADTPDEKDRLAASTEEATAKAGIKAENTT